MGQTVSSSSCLTLVWGDEPLAVYRYEDLLLRFPRLLRIQSNITVDFHYDRMDLAPRADGLVRWAILSARENRQIQTVSDFGGVELLRHVVLLFLSENPATAIEMELQKALRNEDYLRDIVEREPRGQLRLTDGRSPITEPRDITEFLALFECVTEVGKALGSFTSGKANIMYNLHRFYDHHQRTITRLADTKHALRFFRIGDILMYEKIKDDFGLMIMAAFHNFFPSFHGRLDTKEFFETHGRRHRLTFRICSELLVKYQAFEARKMEREELLEHELAGMRGGAPPYTRPQMLRSSTAIPSPQLGHSCQHSGGQTSLLMVTTGTLRSLEESALARFPRDARIRGFDFKDNGMMGRPNQYCMLELRVVPLNGDGGPSDFEGDYGRSGCMNCFSDYNSRAQAYSSGNNIVEMTRRHWNAFLREEASSNRNRSSLYERSHRDLDAGSTSGYYDDREYPEVGRRRIAY